MGILLGMPTVGIAFQLLTVLALPGLCLADNVPANFVFGDSLVEVGNNNYIVSLSKANFIPNGIDFGKPTGRYTNGRTIVDIVGQEIGLKDFTPPYLDPTTTGPVVLQGVSYASGGGGILNHTGKIFRLYNMGARKIIVVNVGPIGCIPYQREINPSAGENCVAFPNELAQMFNAPLKDLVAELSANLKGATFIYADVYRIVDDIVQNYKSYGFEIENSACCAVAGKFGGLIPCGPKSKVCPDRSKYVFWDPYHPTDATNVIIAKRLMDGDSDDISPVNIRHLMKS
ncbi:GDSL esterase/lipase At4g16230-like isoform X2 [Rhododendron vialii]|uniref:GDSL esterase/lipase At4g16230-like isoform X2 n=1 Tax=Rhododendron vialii TaxID=182163 RepID=UPI00265DC200|nr:GDSL esterase/lipase At4g16230-like isoform X2 [Rhododendron vialii]